MSRHARSAARDRVALERARPQGRTCRHDDRPVPVSLEARGQGAWWAEPDPDAIERCAAELKRRTARTLPGELAAFWARCNGLVIGIPGPGTPVEPVVPAHDLIELYDLVGGELIVGADDDALFEYLEGAVPGHLLRRRE